MASSRGTVLGDVGDAGTKNKLSAKPKRTEFKKPAKRYFGKKQDDDTQTSRRRLRSAGRRVERTEETDPIPGPAPIHTHTVAQYRRQGDVSSKIRQRMKHGGLIRETVKYDTAVESVARRDLLQQEETGFLEADVGEETADISQFDIADNVDISSAQKFFDLDLKFGPYRFNYTRNGRFLVLGGYRGHCAAMDWVTKKLVCEINVMETVRDIKWLHLETMYAVAQRKWLYIYDNSGIELHCIKRCDDVNRMEFLPYHFLLATCNSHSFLQYLDVSMGKLIHITNTKEGSLNVMAQNPQNAIIHLGHSRGTVSLWSPNSKEPLVKMLCHKSPVRAVAVDNTGVYMATAGQDGRMKIFDMRTYKPVQTYRISTGASELSFSQTGLLSVAMRDSVYIYTDPCRVTQCKPYITHSVRTPVSCTQFCPHEDVLGIGHSTGFNSIIVPGAGEANIDALECNPYQSKKQRQESEVKSLLEKIQPEMITLDPHRLGHVKQTQIHDATAPKIQKIEFDPRYKKKGKSKSGKVIKRKKGVIEERKKAMFKDKIIHKTKKSTAGQTGVFRTTLDRFT